MEQFETDVLKNFSHPPKLWWRYVDDTFVIIQRRYVDDFLEYLNTRDVKIRFKMELQSDQGCIPFLDCLVHRTTEGRLRTTLYRKPMDTERILNYKSAHPKYMHANIAYSMFKRGARLCTDDNDKRIVQRIDLC